MSSATSIICNGSARAISCVAAFSLHAISGVAGLAKSATGFAGTLIATATVVDTFQFNQFGINNMSEFYKFNNCASPAPTLLNLSSKLFKELDCYDAKKKLPEFFQLQTLIFPVVVSGLALSYRVFSKIESGADRWASNFAHKWDVEQMMANIEANKAVWIMVDREKAKQSKTD